MASDTTLRWIQEFEVSKRVELANDIEAGVVKVDVVTSEGVSLAWRLVEMGETALLEKLLNAVVRPEKLYCDQWWTQTNGDGDTILMKAVRRDSPRLVKTLLSLVCERNSISSQPIERAMVTAVEAQSSGAVLKHLHAAAPWAMPPPTALHMAVKSRNAALVTAWREVGALVESKDAFGCVPAHYAVDACTLEALVDTASTWVFVKRNSRPLEHLPPNCTPLDAMAADTDLVAMVLAALSPSVREAVLRRRDANGNTLLHTLSLNHHDAELHSGKLAQYLTLHTIVNAAGVPGVHQCAQTNGQLFAALWSAFKSRSSPNTIDLHALDAQGRTFLHCYAARDEVDVTLLNDVAAQFPHLFDAQDEQGDTVLHVLLADTNTKQFPFPRGIELPADSRALRLRNDAQESGAWRLLRRAAERGVDVQGIVHKYGNFVNWTDTTPQGEPLLVGLRELLSPQDSVWYAATLASLQPSQLQVAVSTVGRSRNNVFHTLADQNDTHVLSVLPDVNAVNGCNKLDETPLMVATRRGHLEFVIALCRFTSLDLTTASSSGLTLVDVAHQYERDEILRFLVSKHAHLHVLDLQLRLQETAALYERRINAYTCLRCHQHPRALMVLPCRHLAFCIFCADRLPMASHTCFVCGASAQSVVVLNWTLDIAQDAASTSAVSPAPASELAAASTLKPRDEEQVEP